MITFIMCIIISLFAQAATIPAAVSNGNNTGELQNSYPGYVIYTGMSSVATPIKEKTIIRSFEEAQKYCYTYYYDGDTSNNNSGDITQKYNADYFKTKSLAILPVKLYSPDAKVEFISATRENSNVKINYTVNSIDEKTKSPTYYCLIIVEIPKSITGIV